MSNTFDKLSVLDSFIEEVNSYLPEIEAHLKRLAQSPDDTEALEETYRRTHTIGGSASMMDFPGLAHVAHGMEDIVGDALEGPTPLSLPTVELLQRSLARLYRLIGGIQHGIDENAIADEDDEDYDRYREQQDALAHGTPDAMVELDPTQQATEQVPAIRLTEHSPISSLDEMLASFRTPRSTNQDVPWSGEPVIRAEFPARSEVHLPVPPMQPAQQAQFEAPLPTETVLPSPVPSTLELLAGSQQHQDELAVPPVAPILSSAPSMKSLESPTPLPPELAYPVEMSEDAQTPSPFVAQPDTSSESPDPPVFAEAWPMPISPVPSVFEEVEPTPVSPSVSLFEEVEPTPVSPALFAEALPMQMSPALASFTETGGEPKAPVPSGPLLAQPSREIMRSVVLGNNATGLTQQMNVLPWQVYQEMQGQTRALEDQATTLQHTLAQLRQAASLVEAQRTEFKGFLDGSRDALERMEDWAGKAMGLNLRESPEQVRRYLPLSVMWVANSKLKKILGMLVQISGGVQGTEEQMQGLLQQLHGSIESCGEVLQPASNPSEGMVFRQESGWTPWNMQASTSQTSILSERITFERQGDLVALRAEIEEQIRQEHESRSATERQRNRAALRAEIEEQIRQEYESRPATLAARAEMEHQIRAEVREELLANQRLRASVADVQEAGTQGAEAPTELEARLRNEIEIQVRREFLSQLTGGASMALAVQATEAQQMPSASMAGSFTPMPPASFVTPRPAAAQPPLASSPTHSSMGSDFGDETAEIFRLEAEEHLQTISMHVAMLEHAPTNLEPIQGIRRATHTLKGAAGMMGFRAIADLSHVSEDMLDEIMAGHVAISPTVLSLILDTAEALDALINGKGTAAENEQTVAVLRARYAELLGEQASLASAPEDEVELEDEPEALIGPLTGTLDDQEQASAMTLLGGARADLSVRVPLSKLDELVNLFGELLVNRTVLEERLSRLTSLVADTGVSSARLRDVGQRLESRFEAATLPSGHAVQVMPGEGTPTLLTGVNGKSGRAEPAHLAEFDELELDRYTEFHRLARGLSEGISDMTTLSAEMEGLIRDCESTFGRENRLSTTFQDRLMKARLVPLSTMIPRLYRTARAVALKQHKEFELVLEGQETEVDRTVIEEITGPLLHLMRNAVNHALETPEVRQRRGKSSSGQIKLSASYEGNQVVITVRDDGTGIDPERIRNEALLRGLIQPHQSLDDNEIIELIFRPGFSTAEVLSEESGRGVGLDVVRDSVSRLRGALEVESMPSQGTAFTMKFPTSLAIQNAMMVRVGDQQFAIPTVMVEAIGRLDTFTRTNAGGRPAILMQNRPYPLISLAQLLGLSAGELNDKAPLLLIHTDRHRVALVVDDIKGRTDVVIKNLGPHLRNVHGIAGGTVLGNGRVVLILELLELLSARPGVRGALAMPTPLASQVAPAVAQERPSAAVERSTTIAPAVPDRKLAESAPRGKHILIVDDSPSVRRVVGMMLKQHQWEVQTARDGVEALEMVTQQTPAAVLLDIEMPRMDGYELMATVRAQEQYRTLPLVVLTSRSAAKHQQRAMQLGASAYVVKPYQDEELITILNALVYGATER